MINFFNGRFLFLSKLFITGIKIKVPVILKNPIFRFLPLGIYIKQIRILPV